MFEWYDVSQFRVFQQPSKSTYRVITKYKLSPFLVCNNRRPPKCWCCTLIPPPVCFVSSLCVSFKQRGTFAQPNALHLFLPHRPLSHVCPRLLKLSSIIRKNDEEAKPTINPSLWALIKMSLTLFFIAHLMACCWHWLAVLRWVKCNTLG